jgi:CRP-like cAMP-binding protein
MAGPLSEDPGTLMRQVPLLALLADDDIRALAFRGRNKSYLAGDAIFSEGEAGDEMHVVVRGSVRVHRLADTGSDVTLAILGPGECVGEQALLDNLPRSANARALQETRTFTVSRDVFMQWVTERPGAALALLETLSIRLRRSNEKVADLMFLDLGHRLSKTLLSMAGESTPGRVFVTQAALGQLLGVSRESVNKQLQLFVRDGLVSLSRGSVVILDRAGLRSLE